MRFLKLCTTSMLSLLPLAQISASPTCVAPDAKNFVLASSRSRLADGWEGQWLLQNVDSKERIFLRKCASSSSTCYFATDVVPGRYYFQQVVPGALNGFTYPVTNDKLWFNVSGKGVDYLGRWVIERPDLRVITKLEVHYELKDLDEMIALCEIKNRKLFLDQTRSPSNEIVN